ncbi:hypothetical protein Tco_0788331 [Tanacetum coccineum]
MGKEKVQHGCNVDTYRDTNHESGNLLNSPIFPATNEFSSIFEHDVDLEKEEAEVEDDDGDTYDIWDITVKDVKRIRQFLMPNVPDEMDEVIQPLIPQPIPTTPPNDDYVAPDTKSILDDILEEFRDEIVNVTMVDEEAAKDPQSHFTEIQDDTHGGVLEANLKHSLEHAVSSSYRAKSRGVSCSNSTLPIYFISLMYNRDIVQNKWGMEVELSLDLFLPLIS